MSKQQEFLQFADQCERMADPGDIASRFDALAAMARAWRQLAADEERLDNLIRDVDAFFAEPADSVTGRRRWAPDASTRIH